MKFEYAQSCGISAELLAATVVRIQPEINHINQLHHDASIILTPYIFASIPSDVSIIERVREVVEQKKILQPTVLLLIGIGGSSLGTRAVYEALHGTYYSKKQPMRFLCADTIDVALTRDTYQLIEEELRNGGRVLLVVVSKSGKTTETLVNAALFFELIKQYFPQNYRDYVVIITDMHSPLWDLACKKRYAVLEIPKNVGGRFSVFSAVGLFPLAMLNVAIEGLLAGAQQATQQALSASTENISAISAAIVYAQYGAGKSIHDTFIFAPFLAQVGAWYRQLMGESIGKRYDKHNKEVLVGMTPTVSVGSNDLHSIVQLYLAGPYDKITTFVAIQESASLHIPENYFSRIDIVSAGKSIAAVQQAIFEGTRTAYLQDQRPFVTVQLEERSAFELGQFLQMKMFEIVWLGYLLDINVFDQPQVELYKKVTRSKLSQK